MGRLLRIIVTSRTSTYVFTYNTIIYVQRNIMKEIQINFAPADRMQFAVDG